MDVRNCSKCNKIFNYVTGPSICVDCRKSMDELFKEVRIYIRRNPRSQIGEVAEACSCDIKMIRQWIREERLSFSEDSAIGIECEGCGKTIKTGRFCEACKADVSNRLGTAYKKVEVKEENPYENKDKSSQMRFLNKEHPKL
ncbi:MAG: flagellar protein [Vallitaleaceae bacterium]|nr:flagellar protein [Vallitaleaceae bacterium]